MFYGWDFKNPFAIPIQNVDALGQLTQQHGNYIAADV